MTAAEKILDKNKGRVFEETKTSKGTIYWFFDPDDYKEPERINEIEGGEIHFVNKKLFLLYIY